MALQVVGIKQKQRKHKLVDVKIEKSRARRTDFVKWVLVVQIVSLHPLFSPEKTKYHGMLDICVNSRLLWVHADLDCKVHRPSTNESVNHAQKRTLQKLTFSLEPEY